MQNPTRSRARAPGQGVRRAKPPEAENFSALAQPKELVDLSQNMLLHNKKFHQTFRGHGPLDPPILTIVLLQFSVTEMFV